MRRREPWDHCMSLVRQWCLRRWHRWSQLEARNGVRVLRESESFQNPYLTGRSGTLPCRRGRQEQKVGPENKHLRFNEYRQIGKLNERQIFGCRYHNRQHDICWLVVSVHLRGRYLSLLLRSYRHEEAYQGQARDTNGEPHPNIFFPQKDVQSKYSPVWSHSTRQKS